MHPEGRAAVGDDRPDTERAQASIACRNAAIRSSRRPQVRRQQVQHRRQRRDRHPVRADRSSVACGPSRTIAAKSRWPRIVGPADPRECRPGINLHRLQSERLSLLQKLREWHRLDPDQRRHTKLHPHPPLYPAPRPRHRSISGQRRGSNAGSGRRPRTAGAARSCLLRSVAASQDGAGAVKRPTGGRGARRVRLPHRRSATGDSAILAGVNDSARPKRRSGRPVPSRPELPPSARRPPLRSGVAVMARRSMACCLRP